MDALTELISHLTDENVNFRVGKFEALRFPEDVVYLGRAADDPKGYGYHISIIKRDEHNYKYSLAAWDGEDIETYWFSKGPEEILMQYEIEKQRDLYNPS